jgi:alpha-L-fucosidase
MRRIKTLILLMVLGLMPLRGSVTTLVFYRFGEDGLIVSPGPYVQALDSSGNKNSTTIDTVNPAGISVSTNTSSLSQSTNCFTFDGASGLRYMGVYLLSIPTNNVGCEAWVRVGSGVQLRRLTIGTGNYNQVSTTLSVGIDILFDSTLGGFVPTVNGVSFGPAYMPPDTNTWVHLAIVTAAGVTTFYTNGVAAGSTNAFSVPTAYYQWQMAINVDGTSGFIGSIDEYRMFTFLPGAFTTGDLLCNAVVGKTVFAGMPTWITATQEGTNITASAGETLKLKVTAFGASPVSYAWFKDGSQKITNVIYTGSNITASDSGLYSLMASNSFGSVTSAVVRVNVLTNLLTLAPATSPTAVQQALINRKYGMFLCFGPQTFDPSGLENYLNFPPPSASQYAPSAINCDQWIKTAWLAGFRYVVLTAKHDSGFCLWPTKTTSYCVANALCPNQTDVVGAVSAACSRYGIGFGIYYSMTDDSVYAPTLSPWAGHYPYQNYFGYVTNQLTELLTRYGPVCEIWFDEMGYFQRDAYSWHMAEIYSMVKRFQPNCAVINNCNITASTNLLYHQQSSNFSTNDMILYFPSDGRAVDPLLPPVPDPKQYGNPNLPGSSYYLFYEAPQTIQGGGNWFWHFADDTTMSLNAITNNYNLTTGQNDAYLLNVPPNTNGVIPAAYSNALIQAAAALGLQPLSRPQVWIH